MGGGGWVGRGLPDRRPNWPLVFNVHVQCVGDLKHRRRVLEN